MRIDLNSDMGESFGRWKLGDDHALLDVVSSANVACGFHAGDPAGMLRTLSDAAATACASARMSPTTTSTVLAAGSSTSSRPT